MEWQNILDSIESQQEYEKKCCLHAAKEKLDRLDKKYEDLKNLQYERDLICSDLVNYIRNNIWNSPLNIFSCLTGGFLWEAWKWFNYKQDVIDDEESDEKVFEGSYNFVVSTIKRIFFDNSDDFEVKEMINVWGYDSLEITYVHTPSKKEFIIEIPNFRCADDKNYRYMLDGYHLKYHSSEHVIEMLDAGWDLDKLSNTIFLYVNGQFPVED